MISVIFPAYNEEGNIRELHRRLVEALTTIGEPYEIIAVDNASTDKTGEELLKLSPVRIITFAYNIGQTAALDAGIHNARGETIVIIDGDLQNDPADIPALIQKMREGYAAILGWRKDRRDPAIRKIFSRFANFVTKKITGLAIHDYGCALRAFRKDALEGIRLYGVMHVFIPVIIAARGGKIAEVVVRHHERQSGATKYSLSHMATDMADLLVVKFLYGYALRPLVFFGGLSLISFAVSAVAAVVAVILKIQSYAEFTQTPLPIFATLFVILGFLLLMLGFIVELLIRIYYESRRETPYKILRILEQ